MDSTQFYEAHNPPMFFIPINFLQQKLRPQMKAGVYLVGQKTQLEGWWPLALTFLQTQAAALGTVCFFTIRVPIYSACCPPQSSAQFYTPVLKAHCAISHGYDFIFVWNPRPLALNSEWPPPWIHFEKSESLETTQGRKCQKNDL